MNKLSNRKNQRVRSGRFLEMVARIFLQNTELIPNQVDLMFLFHNELSLET